MDECQRKPVKIIPLTSMELVSVSYKLVVGGDHVGTAAEKCN